MCLAVLAWFPGQSVPLTVVANRDEFRDRPTKAMAWWENSDILAGKDLKAGGTWLGFNRNKCFALLTNVRPGYLGVVKPNSRGELITNYLNGDFSIEQYHAHVTENLDAYSGFNLILGDGEKIFWFSSDHPVGKFLSSGFHAISNESLDTPWPKTLLATDQLKQQYRLLENNLTDHSVLSSQRQADENKLPQTGIPQAWERALSAQTILGEDYGTLCRTHFTQTKDGQFNIAEQQLDILGQVTDEQRFKI